MNSQVIATENDEYRDDVIWLDDNELSRRGSVMLTG